MFEMLFEILSLDIFRRSMRETNVLNGCVLVWQTKIGFHFRFPGSPENRFGGHFMSNTNICMVMLKLMASQCNFENSHILAQDEHLHLLFIEVSASKPTYYTLLINSIINIG